LTQANDSYDSIKEQGYTSNIIVPFKNMINDAYSADISVKVKSHLEVKRRRGDFVGPFAVYGYIKDPGNNNRLIVDPFAADVVKDIYVLKLKGLSALGIAEKLNKCGILSPMEYKRYAGSRFSTSFKLNPSTKWQAVAVTRILENEIYTGVLEQGKRITPNYKVRKRINVPKEDWVRVENTHEAIIDRRMFMTVQELLKQDTRASSRYVAVKPLSGIIVCADCNAVMVHKTNTKNGKKYGYYVCSAHRANKEMCSTHNISAEVCEAAVLMVLKIHTSAILDIKGINAAANVMAYSQGNVRRLTARLEAKHEELRRNNEFRFSLYESYKDGVIPREDFTGFKANYDVKIAETEAAIAAIKTEIECAVASEMQQHDRTDLFKNFLNAESLSRKMVVMFLKRVTVHKKGRLTVDFRYANEFEFKKGVV